MGILSNYTCSEYHKTEEPNQIYYGFYHQKSVYELLFERHFQPYDNHQVNDDATDAEVDDGLACLAAVLGFYGEWRDG